MPTQRLKLTAEYIHNSRAESLFQSDLHSRTRDEGKPPRMNQPYALVLLTVRNLVDGVLKVTSQTRFEPGQVAGELQSRGPYKGEVGCEEEHLKAYDHREAGGGDLAADSIEVACRKVVRAFPCAEEGMQD